MNASAMSRSASTRRRGGSPRPIGVLAVLVCVFASCADNEIDSSSVVSRPPVTNAASSTSNSLAASKTSAASTASPASTGPALTTINEASFFCGEFGSEDVPSLIALDLATGEQRWSECAAEPMPAPGYVLGRSVGVTLLLQQGRAEGNEMFAVDDTGLELWRRPSAGQLPHLVIGESTVVTFDDSVEAIDTHTGENRWQHTLAEGTPIAATDGLIVEVGGGPYAPPGTPTHPADAGKATMRALDTTTGEMRWSRDIQIVPLPAPNQYSPTAGNAVLAVPTNLAGGTAIVDIATGADLRTESGVVQAIGDLLFEIEQNTFSVVAVSDALTGEKLAAVPPGIPVTMNTDAEHIVSGTDVLLVSLGSGGSVSSYNLVDAVTGTTRWTVEGQWSPVARSNEDIVAASGSTVRVLDTVTGSARWEYSAPTPNVTFVGFVLGSDIVILVPAFASD